MQRPRPSVPYPVLLLLGNLAFVGAWTLLLFKPAGWLWVGIALVAAFLALRVGGTAEQLQGAALRVGGMWWHARHFPLSSGRGRRSAILTTAIALLGVGLWVVSAVRGTREPPRVQRHVEPAPPPTRE